MVMQLVESEVVARNPHVVGSENADQLKPARNGTQRHGLGSDIGGQLIENDACVVASYVQRGAEGEGGQKGQRLH